MSKANQLPPYDNNAKCPKCGHDDVRTVYVTGHSSWSTPRCGGTPSEFKYTEHLDRNCQRCHYEWAEACLATTTAPAADTDAAAAETVGEVSRGSA